MKKSILALACAAFTFCAQAQQEVTPAAELPDNVPGLTMKNTITWYEIDPGVRTYLILLTANTLELSAELPNGGVAPTPDQQFDLMQSMVKQMTSGKGMFGKMRHGGFPGMPGMGGMGGRGRKGRFPF